LLIAAKAIDVLLLEYTITTADSASHIQSFESLVFFHTQADM